MIRINPKTKPGWIDLGHGVEVEVQPVTTVMIRMAAAAPAVKDLSEDADPDVRFAVLTREMAKLAIIGWRGVGDAEGAPIEPDPESIGALMDIYQLADAFAALYVSRGFIIQTEKKT